ACLSTSPVRAFRAVAIPPLRKRNTTPLYMSGDDTSGSDFSKRHSTCVFVTSPLPPSLTANNPLREARRVRKKVHSLSFRKPSRSRSIARQVPVGCHGGGSSDCESLPS